MLFQDEITAINKSTLRILQNVGVKMPNKDCIEMCRKFGAEVVGDVLLRVKKADKG